MSDLCEINMEDDDVVMVRYKGVGDIDGPTMEQGLAGMVKAMQEHPGAFALCDLGRHTGVSAAARKAAAEKNVVWTFKAIVFFGGTLTTRAVANLVMRALVLMGRQKAEVQTFKDEATMRDWLAKARSHKIAS